MFASVTLVVVAALLGPLLAGGKHPLLPVVAGELLGGLILGTSGLRLLDPTVQPLPALGSLGFAMLMMEAGTHVDPTSTMFRSGFARGIVAFGAVVACAVPAGLLIDRWLGTGQASLLVVLLAGSSAAVAFPIIEERALSGPSIAFLIAWLAIADSVTVVLMPLTLVGPEHVPGALAGDVAIVAVALGVFGLSTAVAEHRIVHRAFKRSRHRGWALQLRLSLVFVLILSTIADQTGASTLIAGFVAGIVLARLGEPRRLALQISGLGNGFLVPAYFVLLGARLDVRALASQPAAILLGISLGVAALAVHVVGARIARRDLWLPTGLAASAQLGLPSAAATLGLASHVLTPATAGALVGGACLTLLPASAGAAVLARRLAPTQSEPADEPAPLEAASQ